MDRPVSQCGEGYQDQRQRERDLIENVPFHLIYELRLDLADLKIVDPKDADQGAFRGARLATRYDPKTF